MRASGCRGLRLGIVFLTLVLAAAPAAVGETMDLNLKFETTGQSMWGPGSVVTPGALHWKMIGSGSSVGRVAWGPISAPDIWPGVITKDTYFWGDVKFGADGRASTGGGLEMSATMALLDSGSVAVTYPVETKLTFPDANDFRAGDVVAVETRYLRQDGWRLTTSSPAASFQLDTSVAATLDLFARVCFIDCIDTSVLEFWAGEPLSVDETYSFSVRTGSSFDPDMVTPYFSGSMTIPQVDCSRERDAQTGCRSVVDGPRALKASGSEVFLQGRPVGVFATGTLHIADIIKKALDKKYEKKYPWLKYAKIKDTRTILGRVTVDYELAAFDLQTLFSARQDFRFDPDLRVTLQFPRELEYWLESAPADVRIGGSAEMAVGEKLFIRTPDDSKAPMELLPTFRLDNTFTSKTTFEAEENLPIRVVDLDVGLPEITIVPELCIPAFCVDTPWGEECTPKACTDPVEYDPPDFGIPGEGIWTPTFRLGRQTLGELPAAGSQSWQLEGFPTHTVGTLLLDPENPIISVTQATGAITRLPQGGRLVPFVIDVSNGGDVPLGSLSLTHDLLEAFPGVRSMTLDRVLLFGVDGNDAFNGIETRELLAEPVFIGHPPIAPPPGNAVLVGGAPKRVIVYARVAPQPDPEPFTGRSAATGSSPLSTQVRAEASSIALLGPGQPAAASDFVLFGEHFVKLQGAGPILGDIGSNDLIEVKQSLNGNVAGDLRAGRFVKVAGSISADYVFSGGVVDVVGKGELKLYGSLKDFQRMKPFTMRATLFAPASPLAGDVWLPQGAAQTLSPGYYGDVVVNGGAVLTPEPGIYFIRSLRLEPGARVHLTGPSTLTVADLIIGAGAAISSDGWSSDIAINAVQTHAIEIGARATMRGALNAPRANILFGPGSSIEGSACGKSITLAAGASAAYHQVCDPVIDADCDGLPDDPSIGQ